MTNQQLRSLVIFQQTQLQTIVKVILEAGVEMQALSLIVLNIAGHLGMDKPSIAELIKSGAEQTKNLLSEFPFPEIPPALLSSDEP